MTSPSPPAPLPLEAPAGAAESAAAALRTSEARYRRLFETAQDGIFIINASTGQIDDVNPYLLHLLGNTPGAMLGKKLWEVGAFADVEPYDLILMDVQMPGISGLETCRRIRGLPGGAASVHGTGTLAGRDSRAAVSGRVQPFSPHAPGRCSSSPPRARPSCRPPPA